MLFFCVYLSQDISLSLGLKGHGRCSQQLKWLPSYTSYPLPNRLYISLQKPLLFANHHHSVLIFLIFQSFCIQNTQKLQYYPCYLLSRWNCYTGIWCLPVCCFFAESIEGVCVLYMCVVRVTRRHKSYFDTF